MVAKFDPDWAVHPGETLHEALAERHMSQSALAIATGFSQKHITHVIHGKSGIGPDFAIALEEVLGISARLWLNLQTNYELFHARKRHGQ